MSLETRAIIELVNHGHSKFYSENIFHFIITHFFEDKLHKGEIIC